MLPKESNTSLTSLDMIDQYDHKKYTVGKSQNVSIDDVDNIFDKTSEIKIHTEVGEYYEGEIDMKFIRNGEGTYHYNNGDVYFGDFKNGIRDGIGEYRYNDGTVYSGQWLCDKKHGWGILKNLNESFEFCGQFEDDLPVTGVFSNDALEPNDAEQNEDFARISRNYKKNMNLSITENGSICGNDLSYTAENEEEPYLKIILNRMEKKLERMRTHSYQNSGVINVVNFERKNKKLIRGETKNNSCVTDYTFLSQLNLKCQTCLKMNVNVNTKQKTTNFYKNTTTNVCQCDKIKSMVKKFSMKKATIYE
jgi:hypothetical protein